MRTQIAVLLAAGLLTLLAAAAFGPAAHAQMPGGIGARPHASAPRFNKANVGGSPAAVVIASGTAALGTSSIASGAKASTVTATATGVLSTDTVVWAFNADVSAVTGYTPSSGGMLTILVNPSANAVNFIVANNTAGSITPGAVTLNWTVLRKCTGC